MTDVLAWLDALFDRPDRNEWTDADAASVLDKALRAVINRHKSHSELVWPDPGETEMKERLVCVECSGWGPYVDWPCSTVQDIAGVLAVNQPEPPPAPARPNPCYWSGSTRVHVKPGCRCGSLLSQGLERLMP